MNEWMHFLKKKIYKIDKIYLIHVKFIQTT